jgi:hypothetical protein
MHCHFPKIIWGMAIIIISFQAAGMESDEVKAARQFAGPPPPPKEDPVSAARRFALSPTRRTPPTLLSEAQAFLKPYSIPSFSNKERETCFSSDNIRNTAARILAQIPQTEWETFIEGDKTVNLKVLGERGKKLKP